MITQLVQSINFKFGREISQDIGPWEAYKDPELVEKFHQLVGKLYESPDEYFRGQVPIHIWPHLVFRRKLSNLIKCTFDYGERKIEVFLKFPKLREMNEEDREILGERISRECTITKTLFGKFQDYEDRNVPEIIAFFPEDLVLVVKEIEGKRLMDELCHLGMGFPKNKDRECLEQKFFGVGEWLKLFHLVTEEQESDRNPLDELMPYVDLRLQRLEKRGIISRNVRKDIQGFLVKVGGGASSNVRTCGVHGDFSLSNILINHLHVNVLDFGMYRSGFGILDLAYLYQRLESYSSHPFLGKSLLHSLQENLLQGYQFQSGIHGALFAQYRIRHMINQLSEFGRVKHLPVPHRIYQGMQFKKCYSNLMDLLREPCLEG